jgi:hypothetical protein
MNKKNLSRAVALLIVFTVTLSTSSCLELKEIRTFAELAGDVGDRFPALVTDLYESCKSEQRYIVAQKHDYRLDRIGDLNDDSNPLMQEGLQQCKIYKNEQERLTKANAILVAYLKSMGDLAADKLTNFDKNIEGFGKAATAGKLLDDSQSTAIMGLAKVLSHIAAEGYRRKKLRDVIKETNSDIQAVTSALSTIVSHNYELQLENERVAMQAYYAKLTQQEVRFNQLQASAAQATLNALQKRGEMSDPSLLEVLRNRSEFPSPAVLDDLKTSYETKNAAINVKKKGAEAYVKILKNVGEGHQKLYDNADKLSSREVLSTALSYAKTIEALAGDFQKAF